MKKKPVEQTLSDKTLQKLNEKKHREKYPMCARLSDRGEERRGLVSFLDWLRDDKKLLLANSDDVDRNGFYNSVPMGDSDCDKLVMEYLEIDVVKLEEERRAMLEELQEAAPE